MAITVPASISSGDLLDLTVKDAINPSSASTAYTITILGNVTGPPAVMPFPDAGVTYPNGAIVDFSGAIMSSQGGPPSRSRDHRHWRPYNGSTPPRSNLLPLAPGPRRRPSPTGDLAVHTPH